MAVADQHTIKLMERMDNLEKLITPTLERIDVLEEKLDEVINVVNFLANHDRVLTNRYNIDRIKRNSTQGD